MTFAYHSVCGIDSVTFASLQEVESILHTTYGFPCGYVIKWYEGSFQASEHQDGPKATIRIQQFGNKMVTLLPEFQPVC